VEAHLTWHHYDAETPDAPTALLLHGFMGCGSDWQPIAEGLSPVCRCLCPDLPGHGVLRQDEVNAAAGMPEIAEAIVAELDARGVKRCGLVGYSMGGRLALYLAVRHPRRFSCLALVSASPGLRTLEERRQRQAQDDALSERFASMREGSPEFEAFLREWYGQPLFSTLSARPALLDGLVRRRLANHPPSLAVVLRSVGVASQPSLWDELPRIELPTLLITGAGDEKYRRICSAMGALMPCATLESIVGCSHVAHIERPEVCQRVIYDFLMGALTQDA